MASLVSSYAPALADGSLILYQRGSTVGQSFRSTTNAKLNSIVMLMSKTGSPVGPVVAQIFTSSGPFGTPGNSFGTLLATSDSIDASALPATGTWTSFIFTGANRYDLVAGVEYVVAVFFNTGGGTAGNYPVVYTTSGGTAPGVLMTRNDFGTSYGYATYDAPYGVYADSAPFSQFNASTILGTPTLAVTFTDTSLFTPTSWAWTFGDGGTSTTQNPAHSYTTPGLYPVTLTATNANGSGVSDQITRVDVLRVLTPASIVSTSAVGTPTQVLSDPPPPAATDWSALGKEDEKVYLYKVYDKAGTFIGTWTDVIDDLEFSQRLNTPGTTTTVRLGRSANTTKEVRGNLLTQAGEPITAEDTSRLVTVYQTPNSVGAGTDVDIRYNVDVYVHYGEFGRLLTQNGEPMTTQNGEYLLVATGAPLGVRIFSGYVMDYEAIYGTESGVTVTLSSHGMELSNTVILSGANTTVAYASTSLEAITKSILDTNPGKISYSTATIGTTGVSENLTFRLNTKLEGIKSVYDQTPAGWYWYVNVAENLLYLQPVSTGYDHVFTVGKHIKELRVKRSIENLVNELYFVGGEATPGTPSTTVYKKYTDATSQTAWGKGLERITDRRYLLTASMQRRADKQISRFKDPIFTSPLTISSARYDIESIKLGQTVGFRNFGNFIDALAPLQIVSLSYKPTEVTIELGDLQDRQVDQVADVDETLANEQYGAIPNAPS